MPFCSYAGLGRAVLPFVVLVSFAGTGLGGGEESRVREFPTVGLLPKAETGALRFLADHPHYDGRGVVVAVFDTGVDPGAAGLSQTSDGRPKFVDLIDATGDGDVPMSKAKAAEDGKLEGLTGRMLTINPEWKNPTGDYRLGLKRAYELFPAELVDRLNKERRVKWNLRQHERAAKLRQRLVEWEEKHPEPSPKQQIQRDELQARIDALAQAQDTFEDPGPIYDCVVFHDGDVWRAVVDTDEDGDLSDETVLTDYHREQQYATFSEQSQLNFSVNIYDDGKTLSLVTVSGSHGTHVAGILAAYEPDHPERNGVAPGAQLVSIKIGDNRIDSMETGRALVRGLRAVIDRKCDLINMSYGEPTSTPNRGRLAELFTEIVQEHNVIFVTSAGNDGPALSTIGAPATTEALLSIGAYVSPEMMSPQYGLLQTLDGMPYTWSSRGPTTDGAVGVDLFAPGGAFAPVPNYELRRTMQANGTSMASPNACGNVALLLSGLRALGIEFTPALIRKALQNTADPLSGVEHFAQGAGLIQTDRAWEWLTGDEVITSESLAFEVAVDPDNARGVLLREPDQTQRPLETTISVMPKFPKEGPKAPQVELEIPITLEVTADWCDVSSSMLLTAAGDGFDLRVDAPTLDPGLHIAEVRGFQAGREGRGPLFRVPVTVIKPTALGEGKHEEMLQLTAGSLERRFFVVPDGATWLDLRFTLREADAVRSFLVHTLQLRPGHSYEDGSSQEFLAMERGSRRVISVPVVPGGTLEVCLAQYWSSLGDSEIEMTATFRGLSPDDDELTLPSDGSPLEAVVASSVGRERLDPSGSLHTWRRLLRPQSVKQQALTDTRDRQLDGGPTHRAVLTYAFSHASSGDVTIRVPELDGLLYDAPVEGHQWMLFDANKRLVAVDDMYPEPISLDEGDYTVRLELRHADRQVLESFKSLLLAVDTDLESSVPIGVFPGRTEAVNGHESRSFMPTWLDPGERASVFLTGPSASHLPDSVALGDQLMGTVDFVEGPAGIEGARFRPEGFPVSFVVPPLPADEEEDDDEDQSDADESVAKRLKRETVDSLIAQLGELEWPRDEELFEELSSSILELDPEAKRRVLVAKLHLLDDEDEREDRLPAIIAAADEVIGTINANQLAQRLTIRENRERPDSVRQKKKAETLRDTLVDALYRKGRAIAFQELPEVAEKHPIEDQKTLNRLFEETFQKLARWADTTDENHYLLHVRRDWRKKRFGLALKLLNQHIDDTSPPDRQQLEKRRDLYEDLGWDDWREYQQKWLLISFPKDWPPF